MSMQIDRHSATFVSTSLETPSRERTVSPFRRGHKSMSRVSKSLQSAKRVAFRAFLLLVTFARVAYSTLFSLPPFFFTMSDELLFCSNISIVKISSRLCFITNGTVRLDQSSFFQVSPHLEGSSAKLELSKLHSHAFYFVRLSLTRVSWEIRLNNSDLTKVFVSRRVKLTATTTHLNVTTSGSPKLGGFLTTAAVWERPKQSYSQHLPGHDL